jgi:hypothetical protein
MLPSNLQNPSLTLSFIHFSLSFFFETMDHVHLSLSSIIILSFFLTILPPSFCDSDDVNDPFVVCNRPYNCGSLINIPYPFWEGSRPQYCGQHGYNLSCRNNEYPVLRFEELEFRVLNINTSTPTFTIARVDLWDGPCPPPSVLFQNTTLNYTFDYASTVQNMTLLYGCPQENIPPVPNRFNCSQIGVSDGKINAYILDNFPLNINLSQLVEECNHNIKVPILWSSATALLEDLQGGPPEVVLQQAMKKGFEVEYSDVLAILCSSCEASDGVCGSNATQPFVCYCRDHVQSSPCPKSGMHALFSSHFLGLGFLPVLFLVHAALSYRPHRGIINFFLIWHSEQLINNRLP